MAYCMNITAKLECFIGQKINVSSIITMFNTKLLLQDQKLNIKSHDYELSLYKSW